MGAKKKDNTTYLTGGEQEPLAYDYIQLLGLVSKYDMNEKDTKLIVEIAYDYLEKYWRW